jgi:hypothetical protein
MELGSLPPENLKLALLDLDLNPVAGLTIFGAWAWDQGERQWALKASLDIGSENEWVPSKSEWHVLAEDSYPSGDLSVYPAVRNGITATFQHQKLNSKSSKNGKWLPGLICPRPNIGFSGVYGRLFGSNEPLDNSRLRWFLNGLKNWLENAVSGTLAINGEPFELPDFPYSGQVRLGFQTLTTRVWKENFSNVQAGTCYLDIPEKPGKLRVLRGISSKEKTLLFGWKGSLQVCTKRETGVWMTLEAVPSLEPWQPPQTFGELEASFKSQGKSFYSILKEHSQSLRDGDRHLALIGFPLPEKIGELGNSIYWLCLRIPKLAQRASDGFRSGNADGLWIADLKSGLKETAQIEWVRTSNWDEIRIRGGVTEDLAKKKIVFIGAGSLGSAVCLLACRAGIRSITILDGEKFVPGNLPRHVLGIDSIDKNKATEMAAILRSSDPKTTVLGIAEEFPPASQEVKEILRSADIIVDCTTEDAVLEAMDRFDWGKPKTFLVFSFNWGAQTLYCYSRKSATLGADIFKKEIGPYSENEAKRLADMELPREGLGCFHPVFPARWDDVMLLASCAFKFIEAQCLSLKEGNSVFKTYSASLSEGYLSAVSRI